MPATCVPWPAPLGGGGEWVSWGVFGGKQTKSECGLGLLGVGGVNEVGKPSGAAFELLLGVRFRAFEVGREKKGIERERRGITKGTYSVGHVNTRVDDVRAGARASSLVVDIRGGTRGTVRDARQTPGDVVSLGDRLLRGDDGVLLNVLDL